jgi:Mrp family chromosome partitioning ATPase
MPAQGVLGLADVLTGRTIPREAMMHVGVPTPQPDAGAYEPGGVATAVQPVRGWVSVLLGTTGVPNPPALLAQPEMSELLHTLLADYDDVLVDAPPPLQVSDAMPLLSAVDGIVIVARVDHTRDTSARRLMQLLERTPSAPVLGVAANAVRRSDMERYGLTSGLGTSRWPFKPSGR